MSEITLFENDEFRLEITPHAVDGFHVTAPPLARQLGYRDAADMLRTVPEDEKGYELVRTPGGEQRAGYLTEKGFYRVLGQRQAARVNDREIREFVERFQSWVYGEVLPKLRRGELTQAPRELTDREKLAALAQGILDAQARESEAINRAEVSDAALEAATPAIEHFERFVSADDVMLVKDWAALFGLSDPKAREILVAKRICYRKFITRRFSKRAGQLVDEYEWRAYADRPTFPWFDLRPQENVDRYHNGQVRQTLYVRRVHALELGRKVGLSQSVIPGAEVATSPVSRSNGDSRNE